MQSPLLCKPFWHISATLHTKNTQFHPDLVFFLKLDTIYGIIFIHQYMSIHPSFPWKIILEWHEKNGRHDLPWRQYFHRSDKDRTYHVWLSEILLQQTQVSRGIVYYEKILAHYPTIESLAASPYEEFFEYYQ